MKSILVPTGGGGSDEPIFATALAAARLFNAHLRFVHIKMHAEKAAAYTPHVAFVRGTALAHALDRLEMQAQTRGAAAARHVREFCARWAIEIVDTPHLSHVVTASWLEEDGDPQERLMFHSRHSDLVVMGRVKSGDGLPPDLIEHLLLGVGRPILIACPRPPRNLTGTIMVCWRETAEAARAVTAGLPLLSKAERVIFASVSERGEIGTKAVLDVAAQFRWNGVATEARIIAANGRATADVLASVAQDCSADLLIMGAYGHSPIRELFFGGCTEATMRHADLPVLLAH